MIAARHALAAALAAGVLAGCVSYNPLVAFGIKSEPAHKPTELAPITSQVTPKAVWSTNVGKSGGFSFRPDAEGGRIYAAKAAFDAGSLEEARKQLDWVMNHGVEEHRGVARTRLAGVLMEQKKYDEALKVLDGNTDKSFAASVADIRGDIMLAQGRIDEARAAYKAAMEKAEGRNPVKQIAETKLNALGGGQ